ncbi:MAG: DUF423 domain-containing protein [Imperialibacter sp.]|uniref:DUF423 domain-containing protein n=1 Tax=Imperialibacter sp. TaxID=2038411 RepID=UPI0032EDBBAD
MSDSVNKEAKRTLIVASVFGALAVGIGAFGAHSLKQHLLEIGRFDTFETAVRYHFYHTFALLVVGLLQLRFNNKYLRWSANSFLAGILLFSGSLYILCLAPNLAYLGIITPFGGLFFIAGWLITAFGISRQ